MITKLSELCKFNGVTITLQAPMRLFTDFVTVLVL